MAIINPATGREMVENSNNEMFGATPFNITSAGTYNIKSGAGVLRSIIFNKFVSLGTVTIYDSLTGSGTKIGTPATPLAVLQQQSALNYNATFQNGLTIVTTLGQDITVMYE